MPELEELGKTAKAAAGPSGSDDPPSPDRSPHGHQGQRRAALSPPTGGRRHDYAVLETVEAGIQLSGTEVKSVRRGKVQLKDSYVEFKDGQAWLIGAHISPYSHGNRENHEPEQRRKLLLKKRQIDRFFGRTQLKGLTVVPLSLYLKGNWIKVEIALVQGKRELRQAGDREDARARPRGRGRGQDRPLVISRATAAGLESVPISSCPLSCRRRRPPRILDALQGRLPP